MQWSTTEGVQGICPTGWHLPTDDDWTALTSCLEGVTVAGGKMKETGVEHWAPPRIQAPPTAVFLPPFLAAYGSSMAL